MYTKNGSVTVSGTVGNDTILEAQGLSVEFKQRGGSTALRALDSVSVHLVKGETLGLVGESGSGKTTLGRTVAGLQATQNGHIKILGHEIHPGQGMPSQIRRQVQVVFQDPSGSLNPRQTVGSCIAEPLRIFKIVPKVETHARVIELLRIVGLSVDLVDRLPHQLSGGQKQRVAIARAIASQPQIVVCDEPVSALDISIQAQILNLLMSLQASTGMTYLFISHDLAVVRQVSHRIAVMYRGKIVEQGAAELVLKTPRHPYTAALLSAIPSLEGTRRRILLAGEVENSKLESTNAGCCFQQRCWFREKLENSDICLTTSPDLTPISVDGNEHSSACHFINNADYLDALASVATQL